MKKALSLAVLITSLMITEQGYSLMNEAVEYKHGETKLQGFMVYDDSTIDPRPGVIIVHDLMGIDDLVKVQAERVGEMGYIAFAIDMYGKGIRPQNKQEAMTESRKYRDDRELMRARVMAAVNHFIRHPLVDGRVAIIGFGFGGQAALETAMTGIEVEGVVSLYGNLDTPNPEDAKKIKTRVLVLHGAGDPFVPKSEVDTFQQQMRNTEVDWQMIILGGAVHGFSDMDSGPDEYTGIAYNRQADKRSREAIKVFFAEFFGKIRH